jgi:tol-pal system protein YbgF
MNFPRKLFLLVFFLTFIVCACAHSRKSKANSKSSEAATEEYKETFVENVKPSLNPPGYDPDEPKEPAVKMAKISQEYIDSLEKKLEETDKKIEDIGSAGVENKQSLETLKNERLQEKQKTDALEEKLLLLTRQIQELDEKYGKRLNYRLSKEALEENMIYEGALKLYISGNYVDAVIMFKKYLSSFPQSTLADNAQYWIGEGYYSQGDYSRAAEELGKVADFPDDSKVSNALLKKGYCYLRLKKYGDARKIFSQIIDKYSSSRSEYAIVDSAKRKLGEIKGKK